MPYKEGRKAQLGDNYIIIIFYVYYKTHVNSRAVEHTKHQNGDGSEIKTQEG